MTPTEIKICLMQKGVTQADIARRRNVTRSMVWTCIVGRSRSMHILKEIADAIGKPISEIWPDAFKKSSK